MARPVKKGLDYFPFDVDYFRDIKIRVLRAQHGSDGSDVYLYLLTEVYRNGYYIKFDQDFILVAAADLNMTPNKIELIVSFCINRSLFDRKLFDMDTVLSARSIQSRYQDACKVKGAKNNIVVDQKIWLLTQEETHSFIKVRTNDDYSKNNLDNSENNGSKPPNNDTKEKKGKKNKSKENDNPYFTIFWDVYPRKEKKAVAIISFNKINPDEGLLQIMLAKLKLFKKTKAWKDIEFVPHASTWLNQRRWEDEVEGVESNEANISDTNTYNDGSTDRYGNTVI